MLGNSVWSVMESVVWIQLDDSLFILQAFLFSHINVKISKFTLRPTGFGALYSKCFLRVDFCFFGP